MTTTAFMLLFFGWMPLVFSLYIWIGAKIMKHPHSAYADVHISTFGLFAICMGCAAGSILTGW